MSIASDILKGFNESRLDSKIINQRLNKLIQNEKDTVESYDKFIFELSKMLDTNKISEDTYMRLAEMINHINDEEKEHIEELEKIKI